MPRLKGGGDLDTRDGIQLGTGQVGIFRGISDFAYCGFFRCRHYSALISPFSDIKKSLISGIEDEHSTPLPSALSTGVGGDGGGGWRWEVRVVVEVGGGGGGGGGGTPYIIAGDYHTFPAPCLSPAIPSSPQIQEIIIWRGKFLAHRTIKSPSPGLVWCVWMCVCVVGEGRG